MMLAGTLCFWPNTVGDEDALAIAKSRMVYAGTVATSNSFLRVILNSQTPASNISSNA